MTTILWTPIPDFISTQGLVNQDFAVHAETQAVPIQIPPLPEPIQVHSILLVSALPQGVTVDYLPSGEDAVIHVPNWDFAYPLTLEYLKQRTKGVVTNFPDLPVDAEEVLKMGQESVSSKTYGFTFNALDIDNNVLDTHTFNIIVFANYSGPASALASAVQARIIPPPHVF